MKFIHCADIHMGSKIAGFPKDLSKEKREAVAGSFSRLVDFAEREGVRAVLIAGDLFDTDSPFKKDKEFFLSVVRKHPNIDFLYLRGNHDAEESYEALDNLKTFSSEWTGYSYGDVVVSGLELNATNLTSAYSTLSLEQDKKNIVMLHGQRGDGASEGVVNLSRLCNKNVDYLALGHIHKFSDGVLDDRGRYAYSGCLEGRGFDETGEKGFVLLTVEDKISYRFVPFSQSVIEEVCVDISGVNDSYEAALAVRKTGLDKERIYRIILTGELDARLGFLKEDVEEVLKADCRFLRVKDQTRKRIDATAYEKDSSLIGEFIRTVKENGDLDEEEKAIVLSYGLKALEGREVES